MFMGQILLVITPPMYRLIAVKIKLTFIVRIYGIHAWLLFGLFFPQKGMMLLAFVLGPLFDSDEEPTKKTFFSLLIVTSYLVH